MKWLAEFAMRSRWHAILTSMLAAVLPLLGWVSTVIVVLVALRHGAAAGSLILLWTLLPVGALFYFVGDPSTIITLVGAFMMAILLRSTVSWELVLVTAVVVAAGGALIFEFAAVDILAQFVDFYISYLEKVGDGVVIEPAMAQTVLLGFLALGQAYAMLVMLVIARWLQSALYNPGGFKKEFHGLRLSPALSGVLVAAMLVCFLFPEQLGRWLPLLTVPLIFAALGLVHWSFTHKSLSKNWVTGFYACLVLLVQLVYPFLASLALMDSWFNLRSRIQSVKED